MAEQDEKELGALDAGRVTAIAQLNPDLDDLQTRLVDGVVTITWPFSIITKSIAFILAEPDFRLRNDRGQVRVEFHGAAGKALADAGVGGGDEVRISLLGAAWEQYQSKTRLPGTALDWQMKFTNRLVLRFRRADSAELVTVNIDGPSLTENEELESPAEVIAASSPEPSPIMASTPRPLSPPLTIHGKRPATTSLDPDEYASPAFLKRARVSYGSLFEGGIDDMDNDGRRNGKTKKRSRFSMGGMGWRYSSKSPSPEPDPVNELEDPPEPEEEEISLEKPATEAPGSPSMVDEGSQTQWPSAREPEMPEQQPFASFVPPTQTPFGGDRAVQGQNPATDVNHEGAGVMQSPFGRSNSQSTTYGQTNNLFATQPPMNPFAAVNHVLSDLPPTSISSSHDLSITSPEPGPNLDLHHEEITIPQNIFGGLPVTTHQTGQSLFSAPPAVDLHWQGEADTHPAIAAINDSLEHHIEAVVVLPDPEVDARRHDSSQEHEEPRRSSDLGRAVKHDDDDDDNDVPHESDNEDHPYKEPIEDYQIGHKVKERHIAEDVYESSSADEEDEEERTTYEMQEANRVRRAKEGYDLSEEDEEEQYDEGERYEESEEEEGGREDHRGYGRYEQEEGEEDEEDGEGSEEDEYEDEDECPEYDQRTPVSQSASSQQVVIDLISDSEDEDSVPAPGLAPSVPQPAASPSEPFADDEKDPDRASEVEDKRTILDHSPPLGTEDGLDGGEDDAEDLTDADADAEGEDAKPVSSGKDIQTERLEPSEEDEEGESDVEPPEVAIEERAEPIEVDEEEDIEMVEYKEPRGIESHSAGDDEVDEGIVSEDAVEQARELASPSAAKDEVEGPGEDSMEVDEKSQDALTVAHEQLEERGMADLDTEKPTVEKNEESTLQRAISPPPTQATLKSSQEELSVATQPAFAQLLTPGETQLPPDEIPAESEKPSASGVAEGEQATETKPRRSSRRKLDQQEASKLENQPEQEEAVDKPAEEAIDKPVVAPVEEPVEEPADEAERHTGDEASDQGQDDSIAAETQIMEEFLQYHSPAPKSKLLTEAEPLITVHSLRSHDKETSEDFPKDADEHANVPSTEELRLRSKRHVGAPQNQGRDEPAAPLSPRGHRKTRSTDSTKSQVAQPGDREPSSPKETKPSGNPTRLRVTRSKASKGDPSIVLAQSVLQEDKPRDASPPLHRPVTRSMDDILDAESEAETAPSTRMTRRHATPDVTELAHGPSTPTQIMEHIESAAASEEEEPAPAAENIAPTVDTEAEDEAEAAQAEPQEKAAGEDFTSKAELLKHLKAKLPDYLPLDMLSRAREQQCDILAVAASTPDRAKRPRHGPRDYMLEVALMDPSLSSSSVRIAQFYRPHMRALPVVEVGDVVMLRKVEVLAMRGRDFGVKIGSESAWAVYQKSSEELLPQINGPPVEEIADDEVGYVKGLRGWWDSLDVKELREAEVAAEKSLHVVQQDERDE